MLIERLEVFHVAMPRGLGPSRLTSGLSGVVCSGRLLSDVRAEHVGVMQAT